jgi:hypothetical protein
VDEHVVSAVIADNEAETLLRIEEFDDAFALADDLRRHSASAAAAKTAAAAAAEAAASATIAAAVAIATAAATESATVTKTAAAAEAAAFLVTAEFLKIVFAETIALVAAAPAAIPLAPSVETHNRPNSICPQTSETNALGQKGATGHSA